MAQDKTALFALVNSNLPDNTTKLITPQKHREVATQTIDAALNVAETASQTVVGSVDFTGGLNKSGVPVATSAREIDVLRAYSLAAVQAPVAVDTPLKLEFGAAQGTGSDPVMIDALGNLTFNESGTYDVRIKLQVGRVGASGTSILASRILINGTQVGVSAVSKLVSSDFSYPTDSKVTLNSVLAGDVFTVEIVRDSSGSNYGGVFGTTLLAPGWVFSPSALIVVSRIEAIV